MCDALTEGTTWDKPITPRAIKHFGSGDVAALLADPLPIPLMMASPRNLSPRRGRKPTVDPVSQSRQIAGDKAVKENAFRKIRQERITSMNEAAYHGFDCVSGSVCASPRDSHRHGCRHFAPFLHRYAERDEKKEAKKVVVDNLRKEVIARSGLTHDVRGTSSVAATFSARMGYDARLWQGKPNTKRILP